MPKVKSVLFMGDNYTEEWHKEAERSGLPNLKTTPEALKALETDKAMKLFENYKVLSPVELKSRYTIRLEKYIKDIDIEAKALIAIASTQVIPAAVKYQLELATIDRQDRKGPGRRRGPVSAEETHSSASPSSSTASRISRPRSRRNWTRRKAR